MKRTLLTASAILTSSLSLGLLLSLLVNLAPGIANAASKEACIVLQTSGKKVSSVSYDLPDDLAQSLQIKTDLVPSLQIELSAGPGARGTTDRSYFSVNVRISDLQKGSVVESSIRLVNAGTQNQTAKNLSALRYQRDELSALQVTCARFER